MIRNRRFTCIPIALSLLGAVLFNTVALADQPKGQFSIPTQITPLKEAPGRSKPTTMKLKCKLGGKLVGGMCIYKKPAGGCSTISSECTDVYGEDKCRCPQRT